MSKLHIDMDMCYLTYPCKHAVRVDEGRPSVMDAPAIVALCQLLDCPWTPTLTT